MNQNINDADSENNNISNNLTGEDDVSSAVYSEAATDVSAKNNTSDKKPDIKKILLTAAVIILLFATAASCAVSIYLYKHSRMSVQVIDGTPNLLTAQQFKELKEEAKSSVTDNLLSTVKKRLSDGDSATYLLRQYYPDDIVYMEDGVYRFEPVNKELKPNTLVDSSFKKVENGEIICINQGEKISHKGIDLSKYQGTVDFSKVKNSGVEYALIRCGYRGYGNGKIVEDSAFKTYATDALSAGIPIGVYFYTQAISVEEAVEEADFVINLIKDYDVSYPVIIDVEEAPVDEYRQKNLSKLELTEVVAAFCSRIEEAGYTPMIYSNIRYFAGKLDMSQLEAYEKWYASYASEPYLPYEFSIWQYTSTGKVDGISGDVDLNISFKEW